MKIIFIILTLFSKKIKIYEKMFQKNLNRFFEIDIIHLKYDFNNKINLKENKKCNTK